MKESCPLCKPLPSNAKVYFDIGDFKIIRCAICKVPMLITKAHKMDLDDWELAMNYFTNAMYIAFPGKDTFRDMTDRHKLGHLNWHGVPL